jgi:pimeloyl-ACP methyl ester carboxylesterase
VRSLLCSTLLGAFFVLRAVAPSIDGAKLHSSSTGSGKTIILVHGWTCDDTSWTAEVPELSRHHRVVTLDLPGHGQSGLPADGQFSMDLFARAVEVVRSDSHVDKAVLVGHSMGTPVIRQYARLFPQHVAGLVFVDGLVAPPQVPPGLAAQVAGPDGLAARESMIRGMFTPATPPSLQQRILRMMLAAPKDTAVGAMLATFDPSNFKEDVMDVPVLGVYAEKSRLGNAEYLKKIFPASDYVEIPGTGHFLMMEKPDEFNRLLTTFVDRISY